MRNTCNGVGDDEERRRQVIGAGVGVDAPFEVAVTRQDPTADQIVLLDGFTDSFRYGAAVADASHTAVADDVEAQLLQRWNHSGLLKVVGHYARSG